jgi:hypothetical protein
MGANPFRKDDGELDETAEEAAAEEEEDEDLFEEKKAPEQIPYKRFQKVIGERNDLREQLEAATERLDATIELSGVGAEKYKGFSDPAAQVVWDADFVNAIEAIKDQPGVAAVAKAAMEYMKTGEVTTVSQTTPAPKSEPRDERLDAIIERDAVRTIDGALPENVRPAFKNVLTDYILGTSDDLAGLDPKAVMAKAKEFIEEKGFTRDDVYRETAAVERKAKPATTSGKSRAATADKPAEVDEEGKPAAPKDYNEWQSNREKRLRGLFS